ncbi:MAG: DMT family transporter [Alphaproteobacteria bacterium]|nr:DMT family transporter [Alphaproteobacteria bacterium]
MPATVFFAVLLAAALHASWNVLVKGGHDKFVSMSAIVIGHVPFAVLALFFFPALDIACWPYLIAGAVAHFGYQSFLLMSYRLGDLTQVYPIARGVAPLIVTGISVAFLGVELLSVQYAAILLIAAGIISVTLVRRADGLRNAPAAISALITGCFIAGYSLNDGWGARVAGSPVTFYAWLSIINAMVWAAAMAIVRPGVVRRMAANARMLTLVGGSASFIAYAIVVWAFTQAPIPLVTALRETSMVFALLLGVFVLKERLDLGKVVSTVVTLTGAALLRLAK